MRDFENIKSQDKPVLNNANNKTIPLVVIKQAAQAWFGRRFKNH